MKRSLRQDAEHRGPGVDLVFYRFSSGVWWRLPVPSAINKKTVTPPKPTPTHPDSWYSVSGVWCCGSRERSSPHAAPPSWGCWESPSAVRLRWKAQLLAFQHWGETQNNPWASLFQRTFREEHFSLKFRNQFALQGTIKLKTKRPLRTYCGAFYPLWEACRLIRVMTAVHMSTREKQQKDGCSSLKWCSLDWLTDSWPPKQRKLKILSH